MKTKIALILAGGILTLGTYVGLVFHVKPTPIPEAAHAPELLAATIIDDAPATFKERFPASEDVFKPWALELARLWMVVGDRKTSEAPRVLLPFSYGERHITDWSRLFGGATLDAKVVKTVVIPGPEK